MDEGDTQSISATVERLARAAEGASRAAEEVRVHLNAVHCSIVAVLETYYPGDLMTANFHGGDGVYFLRTHREKGRRGVMVQHIRQDKHWWLPDIPIAVANGAMAAIPELLNLIATRVEEHLAQNASAIESLRKVTRGLADVPPTRVSQR